MAAITFAQLLTRFDTWLRDPSDLTFTDAEKTELLTEAVNDPYAVASVLDTTLTTAASTYQYTLPTGIKGVFEVGINVDGSGTFQGLPREEYDIIDGVLYFNTTGIPAGKAIQLRAIKKITISDNIPDVIQEYVLHLGMVAAFELLKTSLTTRFLKNDMTMGDIINSINTHKQRAAELRRSISNQRLLTL